MDESVGSGLNSPFMQHSSEVDANITKSSEDEAKGKFNNKQVKAYEAKKPISSIKSENTDYTKQNKKKVTDYAISLEESKQDHSILPTSLQTTPETGIDEGEIYFVDHLSKQQVIDRFRESQPPLTTVCIRSPKDLQKYSLMQETILKDDHLQTTIGRLFRDEPLTLIFDLTEMKPGDIASINDMLQSNPSCNGKKLGSGVKRVCLVNNEMITGDQASNPDLWRRLRQMTHKEILDVGQMKHAITDEVLLNQVIKKEAPTDIPIKTIDFTLTDNWYQHLFGSISFNENGKLCFFAGALADLEDNIHVVFKNAPWTSPGFKEAIASVYREGCFQSNSRVHEFSKNITLSKKDVSKTELEVLKKQNIKDNGFFSSKKAVVCLNAKTLESLKGHSRIEDVKVVKANMLEYLLQGGSQLVITDCLDDRQWLWLLTQIEQLPKDKRPSLFTDLPGSSLVANKSSCWRVENDIEVCVKELNSDEYFQYDVNVSDSLDSLCQINMTSQNHFSFSLSYSPLLKNLINGKQIVLNGLEKNPNFAASLETLLLPEPYLFIHGQKIKLPAAKVIFIKGAQKKDVGSSLVNWAFNQCTGKEKSPENPIYALLKSMPRSFDNNYPVTPPWSSENFQQKFHEQSQLEKEIDGNTELLPYHQRRALHVLLAKAYRGDSNVYGFIKAKIAEYYPDVPESDRADKTALNHWLLQHTNPNLSMIKDDFWQLAQHCPTKVHKLLNSIDDIDERSTMLVASYVLSEVSNKAKQRELASLMNVDLMKAKRHRFCNGTLRSTLRDFFIANKNVLKPDIVISKSIDSLEEAVTQILQKTMPDEEKKMHIQDLLVDKIKGKQLPLHYENLPEAFLANERHAYARQERRLAHLVQNVQKHPIVFLQGESGAGKTFMAQYIADKAGFDNGCQVIQLSPNSTAESLYGGPKLTTCTVDGISDKRTIFEEGPLLKWAKLMNPPLLILDEANLAPEGLLSLLAGLAKQPPVIHYRGYEYQLSEKHRIILTGNPNYYEGRHFDTTLQSCVPTFYYHPLSRSVLANSIIKPGLPDQWTVEMKQQASDRLLTLFHHFQTLAPGDLITVRDLKDVLATVRQILSHQNPKGKLTEKQINALIRRAFMDSLSGAVTVGQQKRLGSLNTWYKQKFPEDTSVVKGVDNVFKRFFKQLKKNNPKAIFTPLPIQQLAYRYWQNLNKDNSGRIATVVEGPAGWGKDYILNEVIKQWQDNQSEQKWAMSPFIHINANANQWSVLVDEVKKAMKKGQVVVISELNLISSSYLEGLFNNVLSGDAEPGFRLFATVNPGSFAGRENMSEALKSRCTQIKLEELSQQEMEKVITECLDIPGHLPKWIASHFYQLSKALECQCKPVQLTLEDLFNVAKRLENIESNQWSKEFESYMSLPFQSLQGYLPPMQMNEESVAQLDKEEQHRLSCETIVNSMSELEAPIMVKLGNYESVVNNVMTVSKYISEKNVLDTYRLLRKDKVVQSGKKLETNEEKELNQIQKTKVSDNSEGISNSQDSFDSDLSKSQQLPVNADYDNAADSVTCSEYQFNDILSKQHYQITRYFPEKPFNSTYYRLNVLETQLEENGQLSNYLIGSAHKNVEPVAGWPDEIPWKTSLEKDELSGKIDLTVSGRWQALPSLSPMDKLRAIQVNPKVEIDIMRSKETGQLLIKTHNNNSLAVSVDFVISPQESYFHPLSQYEQVEIKSDLCTFSLGRVLSEHIFESDDNSWNCRILKEINEMNNIPRRLNALKNWLDTFFDTANVEGRGEELLLNMLRERQGVCRHKAMLFQMLCHYWGIPARQVNNVSHSFVEVSPDGGNTWRQYQLGGGGQTSAVVTEPNWDDFTRSEDCTLEVPTPSLEASHVWDNEYQFSMEHKERKNLKRDLKTIFVPVRDLVDYEEEVPSELLEKLKGLFRTELKKGNLSGLKSRGDFITDVRVLLSPQFYKYVRDDKEWKDIISGITEMTGIWKPSQNTSSFYRSDEIYKELEGTNVGSPLSLSQHNKYIEWLCDLCETNDEVKFLVLGKLQEQSSKNKSYPCATRIMELVNETPYPRFNIHSSTSGLKRYITKSEDVVQAFVRSIPKSPCLESKISKVTLVEELSEVPRTNSRLLPENMASCLPAFLNQSTLKDQKPVILDFCQCEIDMQKLLNNYNNFEGRKNNPLSLLIEQIRKLDKWQYESEKIFCDNQVMFIFFSWIAQHKTNESQVWRWIFNHGDNKNCFIQEKQQDFPDNDMETVDPSISVNLPVDHSAEKIKKHMNEPTAIVLQKKDLIIMFQEFLKAAVG